MGRFLYLVSSDLWWQLPLPFGGKVFWEWIIVGGSLGWGLSAYCALCKFSSYACKSLIFGWCYFRWLVVGLYFAISGVMSNLTGSRAISYHFCSPLARSFLHPFYRMMCKSIAKRGSLLDIKWLGSFGCAVILDQKLRDLGFVRENHGIRRLRHREAGGHRRCPHPEGWLSLG